MFGFNLPELMVIGIVALIVFGPEKLPEIMSKIGKFTGELRKTSESLRRELYNSVYVPAEEIKTITKEIPNLTTSKSTPVQQNKEVAPQVNSLESDTSKSNIQSDKQDEQK